MSTRDINPSICLSHTFGQVSIRRTFKKRKKSLSAVLELIKERNTGWTPFSITFLVIVWYPYLSCHCCHRHQLTHLLCCVYLIFHLFNWLGGDFMVRILSTFYCTICLLFHALTYPLVRSKNIERLL